MPKGGRGYAVGRAVVAELTEAAGAVERGETGQVWCGCKGLREERDKEWAELAERERERERGGVEG